MEAAGAFPVPCLLAMSCRILGVLKAGSSQNLTVFLAVAAGVTRQRADKTPGQMV